MHNGFISECQLALEKEKECALVLSKALIRSNFELLLSTKQNKIMIIRKGRDIHNSLSYYLIVLDFASIALNLLNNSDDPCIYIYTRLTFRIIPASI